MGYRCLGTLLCPFGPSLSKPGPKCSFANDRLSSKAKKTIADTA